MKQYRKKPVTVEAVQFDGLNPAEIKDFVGENCEVEIYDNEVTPPVARIVIHTLEGDMEVSKGDYVIKGVQGEFYPCKPGIFEQTYESEELDKSLNTVADCARRQAEELLSVIKKYNDYSEEQIEKLRTHLMAMFLEGTAWQKSQIMKGSPVIMSPENFQGLIDSHAKRVEQDYKEQLLKGAVEGDYDCDYYAPAIFLDKNLDGIKDGDKVKLIIIKDDE